MSLSGRVALVTGASQGIGRVCLTIGKGWHRDRCGRATARSWTNWPARTQLPEGIPPPSL